MSLAAFQNEPPLDFSRAEVRIAFQHALDRVRASFPLHAALLIDNKERETAEKIALSSPNDTLIAVGESASASADDADDAIRAATRAFPNWSHTEPGERAEFLLAIAGKLRAHRMELAALEVFEAAKPWREADADVAEAIDFCEYYAREMLRLTTPTILQPQILGERNELEYLPMGVVGVIGPWNFPLAIPLGMLAAALVAGNTVVWKPAEQTPLITWRAMQFMLECGLPKGVVNYLPGRGEIAGQRLIESPDVQMIAFTGSREVGLHILRECNVVRPGQRYVKRVVAEMGGKNAMIIDTSADIDGAVPDIVHSAFGFSGQKCSACSRLIILQDVYDALVPRLRDAVESLKIAPAWDPGCQINALIDSDARAKTESFIAHASSEATLLYKGDVGSLAERGHYAPPALFGNVRPDHRLAKEEVFGPVFAVMKARTFREAVELANDTDYDLTGGVHSRTPSNISYARRHFRCGNLYVNRAITGAIVGRQPFGGFKMSGVGSKAGGPDYLKQLLNSIMIPPVQIRICSVTYIHSE